jgi:universal stress protein A
MITPINKILVAVDTSDEADQVLETAANLAKEHGAEVSVLHSTTPVAAAYGQWVTYIPPVNDNKVKAQIYDNLAARVEKYGLDPECIHIEFSRPIDAIVARAEQDSADLIVIGSHGRHGVQLLLGSTANGVLHHAKCDVLAVRIKEQP